MDQLISGDSPGHMKLGPPVPTVCHGVITPTQSIQALGRRHGFRGGTKLNSDGLRSDNLSSGSRKQEHLFTRLPSLLKMFPETRSTKN